MSRLWDDISLLCEWRDANSFINHLRRRQATGFPTASTKTYIYMYISDCVRWPI